MNQTQDRLMTAREAAEFLCLKLATIRRLTCTRDLPLSGPQAGARCGTGPGLAQRAREQGDAFFCQLGGERQ